MTKKTLLIGSLALLLLAPTAAFAQRDATTIAYGPRVGFSVDPDQIVLGGQMVFGGFAERMTFDPSLELGFGDDVTVIAVNLDLKYHFVLEGTDWAPYAGAGIGINFISVDVPPPFEDQDDTEIGGNLILGAGVPMRNNTRFFTEARVGLGDIPSLKLMAGWNFRR